MQKYYRFIGLFLLACILIGSIALIITAQNTSTEVPVPSATRMPEPPAAIGPAEPFTFAVFGDNRPSSANSAQPEAFRVVLKAIDALNPAFAINTGDSVYGSSDSKKMQAMYNAYKDVTKSLLRAKVYLTLGNHEILGSRANQAFFTKELGAPYYSFDYGNSHFIVLDSEVVGEAGRIIGKQLEWLKGDLNKARAAKHKFVFVHRPMYPVDGHKGSSLDQYPKYRDALHSLFVRYRVDAVFAGHEHLFNYQVKNTVRYIITGGGGAPLYPSYLGTGDFYHFTMVTVDGSKVEMKVVKPEMKGHRKARRSPSRRRWEWRWNRR